MDRRSLVFIFSLTITLMFVNMYFGNKQQVELPAEKPKVIAVENVADSEPTSAIVAKEETFFVLENTYQQLVFSDRGGALVEINLPFARDDDDKSVVREIEYDKKLAMTNNGRFPLRPYYTPATPLSKNEYIKHNEQNQGGYSPLIRRPLYNDGSIAIISPEYYCCNIVSEYPELAMLQYNVKSFTETSIVFEGVQSHRRITKTYSFSKEAPYCIDLTIDIEGSSRGLWLTSGVPEVEIISGKGAPEMKYRITRAGKPEVEKVSLPKDETTVSSLYPDWTCTSNGFFGIIIDPLTEIAGGYKARRIEGAALPTRLSDIEREHKTFKVKDFPGYEMLMPLPSGSHTTTKVRLFAGPFSDDVLKFADEALSESSTGYTPGYVGCKSFHGWFSFISAPFSKILLVIMNVFHSITGSWGISIILLTVVLRILLYPLNAWSMKSMHKMKEIAPLVAEIQEKYKKDPKKIQMETMKLYKKKKINPLSGCFPLLIQMPFLIGMFDLLKSAFVLRGAPFIPGWIDNLTAPDVLFSWETPIIFFGTSFHLLPVLLGVTMFLQQKFMSTAPKDKSLLTEQQKQQQMMSKLMVVFFAFMFYKFPSGLNIYWMSSMLLSAGQQWFTNKRLDKVCPEERPVIVTKKETHKKHS